MGWYSRGWMGGGWARGCGWASVARRLYGSGVVDITCVRFACWGRESLGRVAIALGRPRSSHFGCEYLLKHHIWYLVHINVLTCRFFLFLRTTGKTKKKQDLEVRLLASSGQHHRRRRGQI